MTPLVSNYQQGLKDLLPASDLAAFRAELSKIRSEHCAYDDLEFAEDMRCLAVPVFEAGGTVLGSIAISGPASRFDIPKLEELRIVIQIHADALSRELGWVVGKQRIQALS